MQKIIAKRYELTFKEVGEKLGIKEEITRISMGVGTIIVYVEETKN